MQPPPLPRSECFLAGTAAGPSAVQRSASSFTSFSGRRERERGRERGRERERERERMTERGTETNDAIHLIQN